MPPSGAALGTAPAGSTQSPMSPMRSQSSAHSGKSRRIRRTVLVVRRPQQHEMRRVPANFRAGHHQPEVRRLGMLAAGLQAMRHRRRKADAIAGKTILDAFLHLRIEGAIFFSRMGGSPLNSARALLFRMRIPVRARRESPLWYKRVAPCSCRCSRKQFAMGRCDDCGCARRRLRYRPWSSLATCRPGDVNYPERRRIGTLDHVCAVGRTALASPAIPPSVDNISRLKSSPSSRWRTSRLCLIET